MEFHGKFSMELHGILSGFGTWNSTKFYGKFSMELHGILGTWNSMEGFLFQGIPWNCMEVFFMEFHSVFFFHGIVFMEFYGFFSMYLKVFHGI